MNFKLLKFIQRWKKKLTLFDVAIFILIAGIAFFFLFILFRSKQDITVIIEMDDVNQWYAYSLHEGQTQRDEIGRKLATIDKAQFYTTSVENKKIAFVTLKISAVFSRATQQYSYQGQPLLVGAPLRIDLNNILLDGHIVEVDSNISSLSYKKETVTVEGKLLFENPIYHETEGVPDYVANAFSIGDEVKDALGNVALAVVDKNVAPAQRYTFDSTGHVFVVADPLRKDIAVKLKLLVQNINGEKYYLNHFRVGVNSILPIDFENATLFVTLTKIY